MSYHTFFTMSTGLAKPISVPKGLHESIMSHVLEIERVMGIELERFPDKPGVPLRWNHWKEYGKELKDKEFCNLASKHNAWIIDLYKKIGFWAKKPFTVGKGNQDEGLNQRWPSGWEAETITPEQASVFWRALNPIQVPTERWSRDYYRKRMEVLYEVMRGRPTEGIEFDAAALKPKQAAEVINLFSEFLDKHDLRLDVPNGHDHLASSYDGGYKWCEKCGPVDPDDGACCRKRKCPIREEEE